MQRSSGIPVAGFFCMLGEFAQYTRDICLRFLCVCFVFCLIFTFVYFLCWCLLYVLFYFYMYYVFFQILCVIC